MNIQTDFCEIFFNVQIGLILLQIILIRNSFHPSLENLYTISTYCLIPLTDSFYLGLNAKLLMAASFFLFSSIIIGS